MSISVSIVEDNAQVRGSLAKLIDGAPGFRCVSRHGSAEEALKELPKILPEVVLMDINLPGMNGVECVRRLKPQLPGTQLIMLTVYQNTEHIFNALAAGATPRSGFQCMARSSTGRPSFTSSSAKPEAVYCIRGVTAT